MIRGETALSTVAPLDETELHKVFYPSSRDPTQAALTELRLPPQLALLDARQQQQDLLASGGEGGGGKQQREQLDYETTGDDIKTALEKARKSYGTQFGKFQRTRKDLELLQMNEEEFKESGGLRGHVERGRSLFLRRSYGPAIRYLEFAIVHGRRELSNFASAEPHDILLARQLLAKCLLAESRHREAQAEADRILAQERRNSVAMLVKAEAHYHQCHFERALLIFCQGARSRLPLYGASFDKGVQKSTVVIRKALTVLEDPLLAPYLAKVSDRIIKRKTTQQRQFEILVHKEFQNADLPEPLTKCDKEDPIKDVRHPHLIHTFDLPSFEVFPVMNISASGPLAFIKEKFRKQREKIKEDKLKQQINQTSSKEKEEEDKKKKRKRSTSRKRSSSSSTSQKLDVNMKRLGADEEFLDFLRGTVLDSLQKRLEAQNPRLARRRQLQRRQKSLPPPPPPPLPPPSATSSCLLAPGGLGGLGGPNLRFLDRGLVDATDEALRFIGGRKTFWTAIKEKEKKKKLA